MNNTILTSKDLKRNPNLLKEVKDYITMNFLDEEFDTDNPDFMISITKIKMDNLRHISTENAFISKDNEVINLI